ncbi:MAG: Asd/ArgC dimerization domain-containing protein [Terriglobales bacterium]
MNREGKARATAVYRIAIVGAGTLKGKELAELLPESSFPADTPRLLDDDDSLGRLEPVGDEVTFVQKATGSNFEGIDFAFFASQPDSTRKLWELARRAGSAVVDLSYGLEAVAGSRVRSPWLEREFGAAPAPELEPGPVVVAHPAAVVLALLLSRLQKAGKIRSANATLFEPASEHGRAGMDELHEQTVNLLSFQEMPKNVFDAQVAFNLLARYGEHSQPTLETGERRIATHFKTIAGEHAAVPSLLLVQAPIFHGHVFSMYVELERPRSLGDLSQALEGEHVQLTRLEDTPSNVSAAGQEDILAWIRPDAQRENGFWIWAAADNLRLSALNAIECAQQMAGSRPSNTLQ